MKAIPLSLLPQLQAKEYPREVALQVRNEQTNSWHGVTWSELAYHVKMLSQAMCHIGIEVQECVAVFSENSAEFIYTDLALYAIRAIALPLYATSSPAQVEHTLTDSGAKLLFVGGQYQYDTAYKALPQLPHQVQLVIFAPHVHRHPQDTASLYFKDFLQVGLTLEASKEVFQRQQEAKLSDLAVLLYTSGTSGASKGVELTHRNVMSAIQQHLEELPPMQSGHVSMNFLPMTHIFEKMWCLLCLQTRVQIAIGEDPHQILRNLQEVRPHYMCNVPRFWEKVYSGVFEKIEQLPKPLRSLTERAVKVSQKHFHYITLGKKAPWALHLRYSIYNATLLRMLKKKVGIDRGRIFPTASASLADHIHAFLLSIGIPIVYGYGLTETTATVTFCNPCDQIRIGSVGKPLGNVQVRISTTGEIEVKGSNVMQGYHQRPTENAQAFTPDGWFRTGDLGHLDADGYLYFRERAKDLFKTANGKYIAPQVIEKLLILDPAIEQALVIADGRSFVSALIYPNWAYLRRHLQERELGIELPTTPQELCQIPLVQVLLTARIEECLSELASYEKVKQFVLLTEPFTVENGMLTNSLKPKRKVIEAHYATEIEELYTRKLSS